MATNVSLASIIGAVTTATGYRYGVRDDVGNRMDTLKVIDSPAGGYLGVYHTGDEVKLATSGDLLTWTFRRTLDPQATQPTIVALPTGGFLTAVEYNNQTGSGGRVRLRHYPTLVALLAGSFDREATPARTLSACHEGTPSIYSASLTPDIDHCVIDVGFHYQRGCDLDRQARGRLTNFTGWAAATDIALDAAITAAAAAQGQQVNGNIGDRDTVFYDNGRSSVHEVQYRKGDFGSWRVYLHTWQTGSIAYLPITTHDGSTAFANPSVTAIRAPSGRPAVAVSLFVPSEGAAPGEGGPLIYFREYSVLADPVAGVVATYFDNQGLTGSTLTRIEPRIDIDFGTGRPSPNLGADQFSVRWTGQVLADKSQTYRFFTQTDDGARLWVDGVQLIDDWTDHGVVENSGTIALSAGRHPLTMEFYDNGGSALARLLWSSADEAKAVVPANHLSQPRTGLLGEYYSGITLTGPARTRSDPTVNFNWATGFADPNVGAELISVRWTGRLTPRYSQTYRFYTNCDDGSRLWVNNKLLVDNWVDQGPIEHSGTIALTAGVPYDLRLEYYNRGGGALAQLLWSSPSQTKQVIPQEVCVPPTGARPPVV
jgi:PA14 domain